MKTAAKRSSEPNGQPAPAPQPAGAALVVLTADQLAELVRQAVAEALAAQQGQAAGPGAGLRVFTEREAAEVLRLRPWQLRDERRRGRVRASRVVGRQVRYTELDLAEYLARGRGESGQQ